FNPICNVDGVRMARVSLTEDNLTFRRQIKGLLSSRFPSMEVMEAGHAGKALEKIESSPPDLIFMDIKLPGESGLELTKRIKKHYPEIFVIILTSYDYPEYREAAYENGADFFLVKGSTTLDEISSLVRSLLSREHTRRERN
ncbi:MAG: response regulator transcription factor, partial [Syntrophobacteria bacterium]